MNDIKRIHLKTGCKNRKELINFCLNQSEQYLVIGWSYIYKKDNNIKNYRDYYSAIKKDKQKSKLRINPVLNVFKNTRENDLFWTRDLQGKYWICRAKGKAISMFDENLDIGAAVPVEAYDVGLDVPGQIKAAFNRPRGGTVQSISKRYPIILEYSKYIFNKKSNKNIYQFKIIEENLIENLPDYQLEELVISYIQLNENYYLLSNSIANKSTTIKIEAEFISRDLNDIRKAVVQVKGGNSSILNASNYIEYMEDGYYVYLYASQVVDIDNLSKCIIITQRDLFLFYKKYKQLLPKSITEWENIFIQEDNN